MPRGGARIELRVLAARDRAEFTAAMRASRRLLHPWMVAPASAEAFAALLRRNRDERFETLLACRRVDGAIVGFFNIAEIVRGPFQSAYLSYAAVAAHARRGYMTEGLELVLRDAFTRLGLHRLEANIQPANAASIALVARCGFVKEGLSERYLKVGGRWRDHDAGRFAASSGGRGAARARSASAARADGVRAARRAEPERRGGRWSAAASTLSGPAAAVAGHQQRPIRRSSRRSRGAPRGRRGCGRRG